MLFCGVLGLGRFACLPDSCNLDINTTRGEGAVEEGVIVGWTGNLTAESLQTSRGTSEATGIPYRLWVLMDLAGACKFKEAELLMLDWCEGGMLGMVDEEGT